MENKAQKSQNQDQDVSKYFEYSYESKSGGNGGNSVDPEAIKKLAKMAAEAVKRIPKDKNCAVMSLRQWCEITGQKRTSCAGLIDKPMSYHKLFKELEAKYGFHAVPDRGRRIIKFFPAEPKLPPCA